MATKKTTTTLNRQQRIELLNETVSTVNNAALELEL